MCSPKHANCISGSISGRLDTAVGFIIIQNIFQLSTTKVVFEAPPSIMHQMNILIFLKGLVQTSREISEIYFLKIKLKLLNINTKEQWKIIIKNWND